LAPGYADAIVCPSCRKEIKKEDMESVDYTASQQWDALLEVAKAWARIDRRRELESSDEEAEEQFIDDEDEKSETTYVRAFLLFYDVFEHHRTALNQAQTVTSRKAARVLLRLRRVRRAD
jgi:hypothetical protein